MCRRHFDALGCRTQDSAQSLFVIGSGEEVEAKALHTECRQLSLMRGPRKGIDLPGWQYCD